MISDNTSSFHTLPPLEQLEHLSQAYDDGNPLAAHEAINICQIHRLPTPSWVATALQKTFVDFYSGNVAGTTAKVVGTKGKGNSVLGDYMKMAKVYVRSRAYYTVRRWHANPADYQDMPRALILRWFQGKEKWSAHYVLDDALRHAHVSLNGTIFQARMSAIRKAKSQKLPESFSFGELQAEVCLGLRDERGIFGAPDIDPPEHIGELLSRIGTKEK